MKYRPDKRAFGWIENQTAMLKGLFVISVTKSSWRWVYSSVPRGSVLGPVLLNIFINDLDTGTKCTLSRFVGDVELGVEADTLEYVLPFRGTSANWRNGLTHISCCQEKRNTKSCTRAGVNSCTRTCWGLAGRKNLWILLNKSYLSKWCTLVAKKALGFIRKSITNRLNKVIFLLYFALVRPDLEFWNPFLLGKKFGRMLFTSLSIIAEMFFNNSGNLWISTIHIVNADLLITAGWMVHSFILLLILHKFFLTISLNNFINVFCNHLSSSWRQILTDSIILTVIVKTVE